MSKLPWFPFYPQDWISSADVQLMGPAGRGAYAQLLCYAWLSEDCGLPADDEELALLSGLGEDWQGKTGERVKAKFREENGRMFNDRLLELHQTQTAKTVDKSKKASKAANKRWGKKPDNTDAPSNADAMRTQCHSDSDSDSELRDQKSETETDFPLQSPKGDDGMPLWQLDRFNEFWEVVWLKVGKGAARKAFKRKAVTEELADFIIAQAEKHGPALLEEASQSDRTPIHPATWLNQERYDDEGATIETDTEPWEEDEQWEETDQ